eukprot:366252-Chlamydomonas_euryale.AAC.8
MAPRPSCACLHVGTCTHTCVTWLLQCPHLVKVLNRVAADHLGFERAFDLAPLQLCPVDRAEKRVAFDLLGAVWPTAKALVRVAAQQSLEQRQRLCRQELWEFGLGRLDLVLQQLARLVAKRWHAAQHLV